MLAGAELAWISVAIRIQRRTEMNPITIVDDSCNSLGKRWSSLVIGCNYFILWWSYQRFDLMTQQSKLHVIQQKKTKKERKNYYMVKISQTYRMGLLILTHQVKYQKNYSSPTVWLCHYGEGYRYNKETGCVVINTRKSTDSFVWVSNEHRCEKTRGTINYVSVSNSNILYREHFWKNSIHAESS